MAHCFNVHDSSFWSIIIRIDTVWVLQCHNTDTGVGVTHFNSWTFWLRDIMTWSPHRPCLSFQGHKITFLHHVLSDQHISDVQLNVQTILVLFSVKGTAKCNINALCILDNGKKSLRILLDSLESCRVCLKMSWS